jgi:tetratricopeptide (TPR) repeat protein
MRALLLCVVGLSTACTAVSPGRPSLDEAELLSGTALGVRPPIDPPISRAGAFEIDATMREFVSAQIGNAVQERVKLLRLLGGMEALGLFSLDYTTALTRTPRVTFYERRGNCLSATMLFVALAREAGLDVDYQLVDVPPTWSDEPDIVVVSSHVNAVVKSATGDWDYVVDFNGIGDVSHYRSRKIDDDYMLALFYNNLGAEALIDKEHDLSFRYLESAVEAEPRISAVWSNIGVLYARQGFHGHAEAAYLQALAADPSNRTALTNLAKLYAALGNDEAAALYLERVRRYQERNPYYHYGIAKRAYTDGRFEDSLAAIRRAVRLKPDEHEFHRLRGLAYLEIGQQSQAEKSFARAIAHAEPTATGERGGTPF